jgi:hypothetical protein
MRYSIMIQLATLITGILVSTAALFAWLQHRPNAEAPVEEAQAARPLQG